MLLRCLQLSGHFALEVGPKLYCGRKPRCVILRAAYHGSPIQLLSTSQDDQISVYINSLLQWNQHMNLTAVNDIDEIWKRHVEDSLSIISPIHSNYLSRCGSSCKGLNIVDVGTGPGFPGIILAIACPSWKVTLVESMKKRCGFLEHVIRVLCLSNIQLLCARAENVGQDDNFREKFDVSVARAVAKLRILAEYCLPLVRIGGLFVAAKGHAPEEETRNAVKAIRLMGASLIETCTVDSYSPYGQRKVIVCWKNRTTPVEYPRQPGVPAKHPL